MTRFLKRTFTFIVLLIIGVALIGCDNTENQPTQDTTNQGENQNGNNNQGNENQPDQTDEVAKVDASLQGTYHGDDVVVVVEESKVSITDPTGKTLEYTLYVDIDGNIYILEDE